VGSYRRPLGQCVPDDGIVQVQADLLLETNQKPTPGEFFSLTIAARSGDGETYGEIGLSSEGIVEGFPFNSSGGGPPAVKGPIVANQWYHIGMVLNFRNRTTSYYLDDQLLGTVPAPSASKILTRASMVVYARPDGDVTGGAGSARANYKARFDGFRVQLNYGSTGGCPGLL
jgi:hypothetical protein